MTQLATKTKEWLMSDDLKQKIAQALPKHISEDKFLRILFTSMQQTPKLMQCTQASLFSAIIQSAQMGLEPDGRRAHLLPYGDKCTLILDYKGIVELALRSGEVSSIHADVVCENDEFEENLGVVTVHKIDRRKERGAVYAVYCIIEFKDGAKKCEVMSIDEVEAIRKRSKSGNNGPWKSDFNEMAKKTVFKRASKWLPLSPEVQKNISVDDHQFDPEPKESIFSNMEITEEETTSKDEPMKSAEKVED